MPETHLSPGEPIAPQSDDVLWFEPGFDEPASVAVRRNAVVPASGRTARRAEDRHLPRVETPAVPWRDVQWIEPIFEQGEAQAASVALPGRPASRLGRPPQSGVEHTPPGAFWSEAGEIAAIDDDDPMPKPHEAGAVPADAPDFDLSLEPAAAAAPEPQPALPPKAAVLEPAPLPRRIASARAGSVVMLGGIAEAEHRSGGSAHRWLRVFAIVGLLAGAGVAAYTGGHRLPALAGAAPPAAPSTAPRQSAEPALKPAAARSDPATPPSDPAQRAAFFLARAKAADPAAQYNVAVLYARGDGLVQDYATAASWFREAAINGNVTAQFNLGVLYERGLGVPKNMSEAVVWYRTAAEHDHAPAQYNLALAHAEGRGVPPDAVVAARWYHRAAEQGLVPAMVNFAIIYERGEGVGRSLLDAYAWYRAAAARGDNAAEKRAGELFEQFHEGDKKRAENMASQVLAAIREAPPDPAPHSRVTAIPVSAPATAPIARAPNS